MKSTLLALLCTLAGTPALAQTTHIVDISNLNFVPDNITITVGDSVMWISLMQGSHNVAECDYPPTDSSPYNGGFYSGFAGVVDTFTQQFNTVGNFAYVCEPHVFLDMYGTVTVLLPEASTICVGTANCPCGNDDPKGGCQNSTGHGARLNATGSGSVNADDLVLTATQIPAFNQGLFYMGDTEVDNPFFDGRQCALGATFRFLTSPQGSGAGGVISFSGAAGLSAGLIQPGTSWIFHCWHRDVVVPSPCGTGVNLTHGLKIDFSL